MHVVGNAVLLRPRFERPDQLLSYGRPLDGTDRGGPYGCADVRRRYRRVLCDGPERQPALSSSRVTSASASMNVVRHRAHASLLGSLASLEAPSRSSASSAASRASSVPIRATRTSAFIE